LVNKGFTIWNKETAVYIYIARNREQTKITASFPLGEQITPQLNLGIYLIFFTHGGAPSFPGDGGGHAIIEVKVISSSPKKLLQLAIKGGTRNNAFSFHFARVSSIKVPINPQNVFNLMKSLYETKKYVAKFLHLVKTQIFNEFF